MPPLRVQSMRHHQVGPLQKIQCSGLLEVHLRDRSAYIIRVTTLAKKNRTPKNCNVPVCITLITREISMHVVTKELPGGHAVPNQIIGGIGVLPPSPQALI